MVLLLAHIPTSGASDGTAGGGGAVVLVLMLVLL
jgi:hypothetical protein